MQNFNRVEFYSSASFRFAVSLLRMPVFTSISIVCIFGVNGSINPMDSRYNRVLSICALVWKYEGNDKDALLDNNGLPNNNNNNNWGGIFRSCLS